MSDEAGVGRLMMAGPGRRMVARLTDALLMLVLGLLGWVVASLVVALLAIEATANLLLDDGSGAGRGLVALWILFMALAMLLPYRYEVVPTARDGQTIAKRTLKIAVVSYPGGGEGLSRRASRIRWAVPHGAFVGGSAAGLASISALGTWGLVFAGGLGVAGWTAVYASALLDDERRGWHDKLARTMVVKADFRGDPIVTEPTAGVPESNSVGGRRSGVPRLIVVSVAVLLTVALAAAVSTGVYLLLREAELVSDDKPAGTVVVTKASALSVRS